MDTSSLYVQSAGLQNLRVAMTAYDRKLFHEMIVVIGFAWIITQLLWVVRHMYASQKGGHHI